MKDIQAATYSQLYDFFRFIFQIVVGLILQIFGFFPLSLFILFHFYCSCTNIFQSRKRLIGFDLDTPQIIITSTLPYFSILHVLLSPYSDYTLQIKDRVFKSKRRISASKTFMPIRVLLLINQYIQFMCTIKTNKTIETTRQ
jgi:hypothetical protein